MKCARCSAEMRADEQYQLQGQALCEDCYLDAVASPKTCDPWAVYSATNLQREAGTELTQTQLAILEELKEHGPQTPEQLCSNLGLDADSLQRNFATLRHLELASGFRDENRDLYLRSLSGQDAPSAAG